MKNQFKFLDKAIKIQRVTTNNKFRRIMVKKGWEQCFRDWLTVDYLINSNSSWLENVPLDKELIPLAYSHIGIQKFMSQDCNSILTVTLGIPSIANEIIALPVTDCVLISYKISERPTIRISSFGDELSLSNMFSNCRHLPAIDVDSWIVTRNRD